MFTISEYFSLKICNACNLIGGYKIMEYYSLIFIIKKKEYFCIWYSDEKDGFIKESNQIIFFDNNEQLNEYATSKNINIEKGITILNIDNATNWLSLDQKNIDCKYFLDFWNIITDLANSVGIEFHGNSDKAIVNEIYNKLFYGNNIPVVKGDGEEFIPDWSTEEMNELSDIITDGIALIKKCLYING